MVGMRKPVGKGHLIPTDYQGITRVPTDGAIAQLGERLNGIQEVSGSIPLGSTIGLRFILGDKLVRQIRPAIMPTDGQPVS